MKYSDSIKPISYLKAHASEIIRDISNNQKTMIITHNGEAKVVVQDVKVFEKMQESVALLKILALSGSNLQKGKHKSANESFASIDNRIAEFKQNQSEI